MTTVDTRRPTAARYRVTRASRTSVLGSAGLLVLVVALAAVPQVFGPNWYSS